MQISSSVLGKSSAGGRLAMMVNDSTDTVGKMSDGEEGGQQKGA